MSPKKATRLESPNSPVFPSQRDVPSDYIDISLPVNFRPEESFDSFESINTQPLFPENTCFSDFLSAPSLNDVSSDAFVLFEDSSSYTPGWLLIH